MGEYKVDFNGLVKQIENEAKIKLILSLAQDDESKRVILETMDIFMKHGIDIDVALLIMSELGNMFGMKEK